MTHQMPGGWLRCGGPDVRNFGCGFLDPVLAHISQARLDGRRDDFRSVALAHSHQMDRIRRASAVNSRFPHPGPEVGQSLLNAPGSANRLASNRTSRMAGQVGALRVEAGSAGPAVGALARL